MAKEELEERKQANESIKMAKEQEKKQNKKQVYKVVWNIAKAAIVPTLILLVKILAGILIVISIFSLFTVVISGNESEEDTTDTEEEYISVANAQIKLTSDSLMVDKTQIQNFIRNYESTNEILRSQLVNKIDDIYKWQDDTKLSALFLITVAFYEDTDNLDEFIENWSNKDFLKDCETIGDIAEKYISDDTADNWANIIEKYMLENSKNAEIMVYGEYKVSGNGYDTIFISKEGYIYRNYKQIKTSNNNYYLEEWFDDGDSEKGENSIKSNGCSLVAATTIISGLKSVDISPLEVAQADLNNTNKSGLNIEQTCETYGLSIKKTYRSDGKIFSDRECASLKSAVSGSTPAYVRVVGKDKGAIDNYFTGSAHYMALLDYDGDNNLFYVSNPSNSKEKTGWLDADKVCSYIVSARIISVKE